MIVLIEGYCRTARMVVRAPNSGDTQFDPEVVERSCEFTPFVGFDPACSKPLCVGLRVSCESSRDSMTISYSASLCLLQAYRAMCLLDHVSHIEGAPTLLAINAIAGCSQAQEQLFKECVSRFKRREAAYRSAVSAVPTQREAEIALALIARHGLTLDLAALASSVDGRYPRPPLLADVG